MPSKLMRRSGIAAVHISKLIGFNPKTVVQAGVGLNHQEVDCIWEQWPDVEFFGFEPNPILFKKLRGKYPGYLSNFAVSNNSGTADLHFRRRHKDGSSLNGLDFKADEETLVEPVQLITFDAFATLTIFKKPILLWLDVEGNELKALQGGTEFLKMVAVINVEMTGKPHTDEWCKPWEVHRLLVNAGFVLQYIHTFRSATGQYDAVYVRPEMFRLEYSNSPCRCSDCGG